MSGQYATPLQLEIGPSRILATGLLLMHAAALLPLPLLDLPGAVKVALAGAVLLSLAWYWLRLVSPRNPRAVRGLRWEAGGECVLQLACGERLHARLAPRAFVMPWLVILYFRGRTRPLLLLPDMLPAAAFRRLRVRLRLELRQPSREQAT